MGSVHAKSCDEYRQFMLSYEESSLLNLAKDKLEECNSLKKVNQMDPLDYSIDNLKEEIHKYNLIVAEVNIKREWREGIEKLARSKERLDQVLKEADEVCKVRHVLQVPLKKYQLDDQEEMEATETDEMLYKEHSVSTQSKGKKKKKKLK